MAFQNFCVRFFQENTVFKIGKIFHDSVFSQLISNFGSRYLNNFRQN